ncbi:isochorismatase domain-containing protein 2-like [Mercenaria mercenaria]|uniref:isochorismatase domain-containing protein 2-like n=1 Tax=Mercenaria mercenaria TaxID=6596 RepID=UPI00234E4FE5|nr:isochorismatase domain-containing protein 2-like [Mercenaria mercenaria]
MAASNIVRLTTKNSALFLCDMQEKFRKTISYYPQILAVSARMLKASQILDVPVVVTEQYPKGLGPTVSELDVSKCPVFPKMKFSMLIPEVEEHMKQFPNVNSIMLCGIEGHVCVQSTVLDLKERGYDVNVIVDAVSSRSMVDRMFALQRMKEAGAHLTTSESAILSMCGGSDHPNFREVQKIIWDAAPDSGLLGHTVGGETPV